jgi:periplasmic protein CpxP/Spy
MKKWMIGAMILGFISLGVSAQQQQKTPPTAEEIAQKMTDRMSEKLSLSEDQKKQIYAINLENAKKRKKEMEEQKAIREQKRAEMKSQDEKIQNVLTEAQRKQWEEIKLEDRDRRRPGGEIHDRKSIRRGPAPRKGNN